MSQRFSLVLAFLFLFVLHFIVGLSSRSSAGTYDITGTFAMVSHVEVIAFALILPALVIGLYKLFVADRDVSSSLKLSCFACASLLSTLLIYFILQK